jgi:hypothetical protein
MTTAGNTAVWEGLSLDCCLPVPPIKTDPTCLQLDDIIVKKYISYVHILHLELRISELD